MRSAPPIGWSKAQRRLHWWTATFVVLGFALAWMMVAIPLRDLLAKFLAYQAHKTLGLLVLALTLVRLPVRLGRGRPAWEATLASGQRHAAALVHLTLYALLLIVPILGYFTAATAPAQVPTLFLWVIPVPHIVGTNAAAFAALRQIHRVLAILLLALAAVHALAALAHHFQGRPVLIAMWRGAKQPSAGDANTPQ